MGWVNLQVGLGQNVPPFAVWVGSGRKSQLAGCKNKTFYTVLN